MRMPAWVCNECKCLFESMPWCECLLGSMPWRECPLVGISWRGMLWCKHNLFKNSFYFQNEASTTLETKIFSKLDLLFMKSHLSFDLRLPKKLVITVRKSPNGAFTWNLMIWLKRLIFTIWLSKEMARFQCLFFWKNEFFEIKHFKKIHFFLVLDYGNLTSVKTHRDRLENSREGVLERGVQIFGFREGKGPHRGFRCCPVVAFHSSVYSAHESSKFFSFLL